MPKFHSPSAFEARSRRPKRPGLQLEALESRNLLTALAWPTLLQPIVERGSQAVLEQAAYLPVQWSNASAPLPATVQVGAAGTLANSAGGGVDWYHFVLDRPATVVLGTFSSDTGTIVSLYNTDALDGTDPYDSLGHRLIAQSQTPANATVDNAPLTRDLAAGDYYVAVSGAGNRYFHPFVADSGYSGGTGAYRLLLSAADLQVSAQLPQVLALDTGAGLPAAAAQSPLLIRVDLSGPVDPSQLQVQVTSTSGSAEDFVAGLSFSNVADELRVSLTRPLPPGQYQVSIAANGLSGAPMLSADWSATLDVTGVKGNQGLDASGDGTPGSAHELDLSTGTLVQVAGTIGDDPSSPAPFDATEVDVYHFQIVGAGPHALVAEAFAGRIGSPLNSGLSLFQVQDGMLHLVAVNDDTNNGASASAASPVANPLASDPTLFAGLGAGDYYLTVSASGNMADPFGADVPFSSDLSFEQLFGGFAFQGGDYVLNVQVRADDTSPLVTGVTGLGTQNTPPTRFNVQFSEPVNLQELAYQSQQNTLGGVYVQGSDGTIYSPRLESFDMATNQAAFLMTDRLAPGSYVLHISGSAADGAITDIAGNPLVGNDPLNQNDYTLSFGVTVAGPDTNRDETANDSQHPQDLGTLAPFDLGDGVVITGQFTSPDAAYYQFQVLQDRAVAFVVRDVPLDNPLPAGHWLDVTNLSTGQSVSLLFQGPVVDPSSQVNSLGEIVLLGNVQPGQTYLIRVSAWDTGAAYQVEISNPSSNETPPPLTVGAAPAIRLRLLNNGGTPPTLTTPLPDPSPPPVEIGHAGAPRGGQTPLVTGNPVPASVLFAISAGPVGNVNGADGARYAVPGMFDLVFAQAPLPVFSEAMVRLTTLSWSAGVTKEDIVPAPATAPRSGNDVEGVWKAVVERVLGLWLSAPPTLAPAARADSCDSDALDQQEDEPSATEPEDMSDSPEPVGVVAVPEYTMSPAAVPPVRSAGGAQALAITLFFAASALNSARTDQANLSARLKSPHQGRKDRP